MNKKPEDRRQRTEDRGQKTEDRSKMSFSYCLLLTAYCLLLLTSCAEIFKLEKGEQFEGTLVVYFYISDSNQQDIKFTIDGLKLRQKDKDWVELSGKPSVIESIGMSGEQILLSEASLNEGEYDKIIVRVSNASIRRDEKYHTLALPQPGGEVEIEGDIINVRYGESMAIFLVWDPNRSVSNNYLFNPTITIEPQKVSPKTLLLYVANSGSNYVSVIDRFENRVVGVIGVEKNPTGLVLSQEQERLYVLNSRSNNISVIDTTQDYVRDRIQYASGIEPIEMAIIPSRDKRNHGKLYITNRGSNDVTVVDTFMKSQIKSIRVGNAPSGISANSLRQEVYVANSGSNSISIIDSITDTIKTTINVDRMPVDVVTVKDSIYIINAGSDSITVIDTATKEIKGRIQAGINPRKGIYSEFYNRIYITNYSSGQVSFLIPSSAVITRSINAGKEPIGLAIDESRHLLYITDYGSNKVIVINFVSEVVERTIEVGRKPYGIVSVR